MSLSRTMALGVALVAVATAGADDKPGKLDPAKLVGEYTITEGKKAGEKAAGDGLKGKITITKDKIKLDGGSPEMTFEFTYKVKADATPSEIDMEITLPEAFKGTKTNGIISMAEGTVQLCYHPENKERPKKFESTKENGNYLWTMKKKSDK
jgi:uncharacterized protein (TIGR03067 family)